MVSAAANSSGYGVQLADEAPLNGRAGCDRYVARVVRGVNAGAVSPPWIQKRLTQMGMRPISLAVDVNQLRDARLGPAVARIRCLEAAGADSGPPSARGRDLEDPRCRAAKAVPQDLLITDGGTTVLAIAGVMGGATSEVGESTTDVLVEAAHFDATSVAPFLRPAQADYEAQAIRAWVDPDITAHRCGSWRSTCSWSSVGNRR